MPFSNKFFIIQGIKSVITKTKSPVSQGFNLLVLKMIISSASAYSLVENKYFQQIVKMYTSETLQDRTALRILQNDYYEAKIKEIRNKFLKLHTLAAITDSWTAKILRKSFIHLCIIFLDEKWLPDCIDLGVYNMIGSHTAQNLAEKLIFNIFWPKKVIRL